ncbi:MAG: hypothetical protein COA74_07425 [Gammaproteobacteria bacterium]|nr:MAG: hypothetical protein COA74_07425 [Gammaproteobacteria bacterium]
MAKKIIDKTLNDLKKGFIKLLDSEASPSSKEYDDWNSTDQVEDDDSDSNSEFRFNRVISDKVKTVIDDFIESAPLIEEAGFRIRDLEVELSIIPKLIPHFEKIDDITDSRRSEIINQVKDKRLIRLLLQALFKADNFQKSINMGSLEFAGIEIEITAIPAIRLRYENPFKMTKEGKNTEMDLM